MSAALPLTVKHAIALGHMSKGRVVKDIEQMWCGASKSARGNGKFAAMRRLLSSTPVLGIALQPLYFTLPLPLPLTFILFYFVKFSTHLGHIYLT